MLVRGVPSIGLGSISGVKILSLFCGRRPCGGYFDLIGNCKPAKFKNKIYNNIYLFSLPISAKSRLRRLVGTDNAYTLAKAGFVGDACMPAYEMANLVSLNMAAPV